MKYQSFVAVIAIASILVGSSVIAIGGLALMQLNRAHAQTTPSVIFRLDDVQDHFANAGTDAVMKLFMQKKVPLTAAIIASGIGKDPQVVATTSQGIKSGIIEPALHGFKHVDYTTLNANNQSVSITKGNDVIKQLFGVHPFVFVPPFNTFNPSTIAAMRAHDMNILSSTLGTESFEHDKDQIYNATGMQSCGTSDSGIVCQSTNPAHISVANDFRVITDGNITQMTNPQLLKQIQQNANNYGYSVLVLHPQDFVITDPQTGKVLQNVVNTKQIGQLSTLIDQIKKSYTPTSMSNLIAEHQPRSTSSTPATTAAAKAAVIPQANATTGKGSKTFTLHVADQLKPIVITFDDDWIGQVKYAIPILQKYHYNATFFITCKGPIAQAPSFNRIDYVNDKIKQSPDITTWNNVKLIKSMGYDIENHGMTHHSLVNQPASILQREIIDSNTCLANHLGSKATIYAPAYAAPENNDTVDGYMQKGGYEFARNGYGTGSFQSTRWDLPTNSMNSLDKEFNHDTQAIMHAFPVELQKGGNNNLPVIVYHNVNFLNQTDADWHNSTTTPETFDAEMKYLKDNGYEVHSLRDLKWDEQKGRFTF